jgi:hypothetical protein
VLIPASYPFRASHVVVVHVPVAGSGEQPGSVHAPASRFAHEYVWHVEVASLHAHPAAPLHAACPAAVYEEQAVGSQAESAELHVQVPVHAPAVVIVAHEAAQPPLLHAHPGCALQVVDEVFDAHASGFGGV